MLKVRQVTIPSLEELVLIKMPKLETCCCNSGRDLNTSLRVLTVKGCRVLEVFPLFESCEKLIIEQKSWLSSLRVLTIHDCPQLIVSNPLPPSTSTCELSIERVSTLPTMKASSNAELIIGTANLVCDEDSNELVKLDDKILSFHNLRGLSHLKIRGCQNLSCISLKGLKQLISLKSLEVQLCEKLFSSDVLPEHVGEDIVDAGSIALPSLELLEIKSCGITGKWLSVMLQHAPALEELYVGDCSQISILLVEGIERSLSNQTCTPQHSSAGNPDGTVASVAPEGLLRIPSNVVSSLKKIDILWCAELTFQGKKEGFSEFTSLEELTIWKCPKFIRSLVQKYQNDDQGNGRWLLPHSLRILDIYGSLEMQMLQPCFPEDGNCLKRLVIDDNPSLESLKLYSCTALEELKVQNCGALTALEGNLTSLRKLNLSYCPRLKSLRLRFCIALEHLPIDDCETLHTLDDLRSLRDLRCLVIFRCPRLHPYLERRLGTDDFSFLTTSLCKRLTSLQRLEFQDRTGKVTRLTNEQERALQLLTSLQELRFEFCSNLGDLPVGLHNIPSLKRLEIFYCSGISRLPKDDLPPSLEELEINWCSKELTDACRALATARSKPRVKIYWKYVN